MYTWLTLVLLGLAAFRLTRLFVYDDIFRFIRAPFHEEKEEIVEDGTVEVVLYIKGKGIRRFIGELLSCQWCTGIWSASCLYIGYLLWPWIFLPIIAILAIAAFASIIEVIVSFLIHRTES
ncbi:DUF1360 domain-containing protein [Sediminibacillus albus]|uniref:Sporulation protein YjcA n=1 Tax=Sediminibacillus albus TaxID=407036 RepID=A0A1G9AMG6_9BACI|nr:DUF1360 domain-containing protein [Sediminibacillus albus]SDK28441.1 Protein of unknown function [Sediminibacillus albus]